MNKRIKALTILLGLLAVAVPAVIIWADGNETLVPPSIVIASGSGFVAKGIGLLTQPGTITIDASDVPASTSINQALLYWEGRGAGDDTIIVNLTAVTGVLIGTGTDAFGTTSTYRADITSLVLLAGVPSSLILSGLDFGIANHGAGLLLIVDDGSGAAIEVRDGHDFAYHKFVSPRDTTVPQTFNFTPASNNRTADLTMFFSSISGTASGGGFRPTSIEVTVSDGGAATTVTFPDLLDSHDGEEWDTLVLSVDIPAGANQLTVQAFSRDDLGGASGNPASFAWNVAALTLTPPVAGRITGGGNVFMYDGSKATRGFELHCDRRAPNNLQVNFHGTRDKFHLDNQAMLLSAECIDFPDLFQDPPPETPFDTFVGKGVGKFNGESGAVACFVLVDDGEPGDTDMMAVQVFWPVGDPSTIDCIPTNLGVPFPGGDGEFDLLVRQGPPQVQYVSGVVDRGNIQAHEDNK